MNYCIISAERGNPYASFLVGLLYYHGLGVSVDYNESMKYYYMAFYEGNYKTVLKEKMIKIGWSL